MVDTVNCKYQGYDWAKFWNPAEKGSYKEQPDEDSVKPKAPKKKKKKEEKEEGEGEGNTS